MKACQFSPDDRYQTAEELRQVLNRFVNGKSRADRRKRKRLPDDVYRKKSRRDTIFACLAVMLASFCVGFYIFVGKPHSSVADSQKLSSSIKLNRSAVNLIDKLADRDQDDMVKIVSEFVEQSLSASGDNLQFSEPAKQEIRKQVDNITTQIKTTGLTEESLEKFLKGYRKTSLPIATKVMRLATTIDASGLSLSEKQNAIEVLRSLAAAAINGYISERDVDAIVSRLIGFQPKSTTEVANLVIPDQRLRSWLADLKQNLQNLPPSAFIYRDAMNKELNVVFEDAFGSPKSAVENQANGVRGAR
jgi:hypothetical protein